MNYYNFHIGDYARRTRHLSVIEDLFYRRLLDLYYTTEAPLPDNFPQLYRLLQASEPPYREAVECVLREFFELTEEGWINRRADDEILTMREKQQKQRDRANKRWHQSGAKSGPDAENVAGSAVASPESAQGNASDTQVAMPRHQQRDAAASENDRSKSTRLNSSHTDISRMPSSA